jgi:hypothetical protein
MKEFVMTNSFGATSTTDDVLAESISAEGACSSLAYRPG